MINKYTSFRKKPWVVLSFPRQDCSIVWDDKEKHYDFYQGTPWEQEKMREFIEEVEQRHVSYWKLACYILTCILGVTLPALLFVIITK